MFVAPDPIDFGRRTEPHVEPIIVQNVGTAPLSISNIQVVPTGRFRLETELEYPFTLQPSELQDLGVSYTPETDQFDSAVLVVNSNDEETPRLEVPITANGAEPCISVTHEDGYDFNQRIIGETAPENFTIQNCSDPVNGAALEVYSLEWLEEDITISLATRPGALPGENLVLNPGETSSFVVEYTPTEEIVNQAVLRITSNDAVKNPLDIDIRGIGSSNGCPTAVAVCRVVGSGGGYDSEVSALPLQELECDATQSIDADGAIDIYEWTVIERPVGSVAPFTPAPNVADPNFFVDLAGRYVFRLNVIDDGGAVSCEPADVTVVAVPDETIHVQLTWHTPNDPDETDFSGTDLDLHFLHPLGSIGHSRYDVHWLNKTPNWGGGLANPSLDIDDTNGAGPENINLDGPEADSNYRVGVHYWSDSGLGASDATIRIYIYGLLQFELTRTLASTDDYWDVAAIIWDSGDVVRIDTVEDVCVASDGAFGC